MLHPLNTIAHKRDYYECGEEASALSEAEGSA